MKKIVKHLGVIAICLVLSENSFSQDKTYKNSVGMQFTLIQPGSMLVGKFEPTISRPGAGRGGAGAGFGGGTPGQAGVAGQPGGATTPAQTPSGQGAPSTPNQGGGAQGGAPGQGGGARGGRGGAPQVPIPQKYYAAAEQMAKQDALPGFEVKIEKPYYIGIYEVTQEQYQKVMGINPSIFQGAKVTDDASQHPVENVTWQDCQAFIKKLNKLEKGKATYRLPSEFEWEYAARAGATDDIPWADIRTNAVISQKTTAVVGTKKPNAWGLYDTLGNVWEWVQDVYNEKIFADPVPPKSGKEHVLKGAPFYGDVKNATYMTHAGGPGSKYDTGFRIVMEVKK